MSHTVRRLVRNMRSRDARARGPASGASDLHAIREANRALVLNSIRLDGPRSRVAIARRTGLSRTTVSSIVESLLKEGLAREGDTQSAAPSGGRRPTLVHFNESAGVILGVDLGRSHCTIIATDLAANVLARESDAFDATLGADVCLSLLVAALRRFVAAHDIARDSILGLGVGIPGPVDAQQRVLVHPPRMPGWDGVDVRRILRRELDLPVCMGNDANMGALGESRYGAGRGLSDFAYIKVGSGIGCGLVISGNVYRGSQGSAGELGHVTIDENGPLCDCGNRGCLETVSSGPAIVRDAVEAISLNRQRQAQGLAPVAGSAALLWPGSETIDAQKTVDVADVVQAALDGDPASRAAIERAGELIGVALASLINLVNPSVILVDGGVARAGELLLGPIRRAIAARSLSAASANTRLVSGELGTNAIALGAVAAVIDAAFGAPTLTSASVSLGPPLAALAADTDASAGAAAPA